MYIRKYTRCHLKILNHRIHSNGLDDNLIKPLKLPFIFNRQFGSSNKKGVFEKKGFFHRYTGYILQYNEDDLDRPYSICLSPDEKELYVADRTKQIKVYKTSC